VWLQRRAVLSTVKDRDDAQALGESGAVPSAEQAHARDGVGASSHTSDTVTLAGARVRRSPAPTFSRLRNTQSTLPVTAPAPEYAHGKPPVADPDGHCGVVITTTELSV
jgi:hypothetical protein